jgi:hypothetical protein
MSDEIINKVANSSLVTIDLQDYYPDGDRVVFDLKDWLYEELILREKDFRENLKNHDCSVLGLFVGRNLFVANCETNCTWKFTRFGYDFVHRNCRSFAL